MNIALTYADTHQVIRELQSDGGVEAKTAEAIIKAVQRAKLSGEPATQADLIRLEGTLRTELYKVMFLHGLLTVTVFSGIVFGLLQITG